MESFLIGLIVLVACVIVGMSAKAGAERDLRRREQRWSVAPVAAGEPPAPPMQHDPYGHEPALGSNVDVAAATAAPASYEPAKPSRSRASASRSSETGSMARPARTRPRPASGPVNINDAGVDGLRSLPGVGARAAERIVAHREQYGPFASVTALEAVEGFDHHRVLRLSDRATV